jgi:hypothetical protein
VNADNVSSATAGVVIEHCQKQVTTLSTDTEAFTKVSVTLFRGLLNDAI